MCGYHCKAFVVGVPSTPTIIIIILYYNWSFYSKQIDALCRIILPPTPPPPPLILIWLKRSKILSWFFVTKIWDPWSHDFLSQSGLNKCEAGDCRQRRSFRCAQMPCLDDVASSRRGGSDSCVLSLCMEISTQLHAPAAVSPGTESYVPRAVARPVLTCGLEKIPCTWGELNPDVAARSQSFRRITHPVSLSLMMIMMMFIWPVRQSCSMVLCTSIWKILNL